MKINNIQLSDEKILKKISVKQDLSIKETIKIINSTALQVAIVINKKNKYLGIITDGDIRRGLVKKISINQKITKILNKNSLYVFGNIKRLHAEQLMLKNKIEHLPILNKKKELIGLHLKENIITKDNFKNSIIIMAGGKGKRLRPFTYKTPKPMIKINNKPILEHIILKLKKERFNNFFISVNYLKEKIINFFKNGKKFNVNISYIIENKPLGTIGSIKLYKNNNNLPLIVCNGDIFSSVSAESILNFHNKKKSFATMGVIEYSHENPFGVIDAKNFKFLSIKEKPVKKYYINAGIYVFDPKVLDHINDNIRIDTPELFKNLRKKGLKTLIFPIHETWRDIGKIEDLKKFKLPKIKNNKKGIIKKLN